MHLATGRNVARVLVPAALVTILSSSCDRHPSAPPVVASVVVSPGAATLVAFDQRLTLHATAFTTRGDSIPGKEFVWSSSNEGIAPVSSDGIVAASVEGTVTITATVDGISGSATITVAQVPVSLSFALPPNATYVNVPIGNLEVNVLDANRRTVYRAAPTITIALASTAPGTTLSGTTAVAIQGVARFPSLTIDRPGTGYRLVASAPGLTSGTSEPFDIGSLSLRSVKTGALTTCALAGAGTPYCWGASVTPSGDAPLPVAVGGGVAFDSLYVASYVCGISSNAATYCWGNGPPSADSAARPIYTPVVVPGSAGLLFASLGTGFSHMCALTRDGQAYCWGNNVESQLGTTIAESCESTSACRTPLPVTGGLLFASISAGYAHTCAITRTAVAYCWGRNAEGQLGDGTTTARTTPTIVAGGIAWSSIDAGTYGTCGIATTGEAYCWGMNATGNLGDGTLDRQHMTPSLVQGGLRFKSISMRNASTCALAQSGAPYCWGRLDYSMVGDASASTVPVALPGNLRMSSLDGTIARVCGLTISNRAVCWTSALAQPVEVPGQQ